MERRIRILGIIYIAFGAVGVFAALLLFVGMVSKGLLSESRETILIAASAGAAVATLLVLISTLAIIGGMGCCDGVRGRASW